MVASVLLKTPEEVSLKETDAPPILPDVSRPKVDWISVLEPPITEVGSEPRLVIGFGSLRLGETSVDKDENSLVAVPISVIGEGNKVLLGVSEAPNEVPDPKLPTIGAPVPVDSISVVDAIADEDSKIEVPALKEASIGMDEVARVEIPAWDSVSIPDVGTIAVLDSNPGPLV